MAAQHFYVTKTGNDSNDGSSWADGNAWLTIQHAADNANPANGTPITIHVAAGTYAEQVDIDTYAGTDDDNRIIFDGDVENESGDGATRPIVKFAGSVAWKSLFWLDKAYITIEDFEVDCSICTTYVPAINFQGGAPFGKALRNRLHGNCAGVKFYHTSAINAYIEAYNNFIYDIGWLGEAYGISFDNGKYCKAYNNVVQNSTKYGVRQYGSPAYNEYKNNIFVDCALGAHSSYIATHTYDNNCYDCDVHASYPTLAEWQAYTSQDMNSVEGDPKFVNEAGDDFHITDNASPCYQAGADLSAVFTDDYDKDTRVHWDIGADYIATLAVGLAKMVQIM